MRHKLVLHSSNAKTGNMSQTYSDYSSCPKDEDCIYEKTGACYCKCGINTDGITPPEKVF